MWFGACKKSFKNLKDRLTFVLVLILSEGQMVLWFIMIPQELVEDVCLCKM